MGPWFLYCDDDDDTTNTILNSKRYLDQLIRFCIAQLILVRVPNAQNLTDYTMRHLVSPASNTGWRAGD